MIPALIILLLAFLLLGMPIYVSLGLGSFLSLSFFSDGNPMMLIQRFFAGIDTFGLMALPFFILAANLMDTGGLSRRILLNYEELGLLTPAMRREDKGFRYYSADNLAHIRVIRNLQELGLSLSAIRSYFGDTGQLEDQIQHLVDLRNRLDQYIAQLRMRQGEATDPEVCMVTLPAFTAYCRDFSGADLQAKTALLRQTYIDAAHSYSLDFHSRMCTQLSIRNPDSGTFIIPVSPESQGSCIRKFDQTSALSLFFRGAYEEFPPLHARLLAYAEAHGMTPHGYFRNIYIEGPPTHGSNKAAYASQLTLPIKFMDV